MMGSSHISEDEPGRRLPAIADELVAAGLSVQLHRTRAGLDLTATLHHPGRREMEILVDEDGYTELRYWADQSATPAQAADIIVRALCAISDLRATSATPDPARTPPHTEAFSVLRRPDRAIGTITGYDGAVTERAGDGGMAGSRDAPTERHVSADSVRKNWPDKADPELVKRLEQLQPGHPSSPYNADGTRKPPIPDRRSDELPIPGDPDYEADASGSPEAGQLSTTSDGPTDDERPGPEGELDKELPTEDKPVIGPDGSWKWKGQELAPHECRIADTLADRCHAAEGRDASGNYGERGLTPAMRRVEAQLDHGHLVDKTEEYALKTPDRLKEKLAVLIGRFPGADPKDLAETIHDGIRYTFIFDFEKYTEGVELAHARISEAGYERIETKPGWHGDEYKGVNSQWADSASGSRFEIQFHTQESWDAKQVTHRAYEKIEALNTPVHEKERLRAYQREVSASVRIPKGALDIPIYKKEGR
jgi:hypothetical protein